MINNRKITLITDYMAEGFFRRLVNLKFTILGITFDSFELENLNQYSFS